jgi:hypothetical protein
MIQLRSRREYGISSIVYTTCGICCYSQPRGEKTGADNDFLVNLRRNLFKGGASQETLDVRFAKALVVHFLSFTL